MRLSITALAVASLLCIMSVIAALAAPGSKPSPEVFNQRLADARLLFTENKGQVADRAGTLRPDILFTAHSGGAAVFLTATGIHYQFERTIYPEGYEPDEKRVRNRQKQEALRRQIKTELHRFTLLLEGANPSPKVRREAQNAYTENFYFAHCPDGITGVHAYERVVMEDVYPGIDWVVYSNGKRLKYDFTVHPDADPSRIRLKVVDADSVMIDEAGALVMKTRLGEVHEAAPNAECGGKKTAVSFNKTGDGCIRFSLGSWDKTQTLTIDPAVSWATYYGDSGSEEGSTCATDASGSVYLAGRTTSTSSIATSGGFQTSYGGSIDALIVKFSSAGFRSWATYYGGSGWDDGQACATDASGNIYLGGYLGSSGLASSGAFQTVMGGGNADAFIAKFNTSGSRIWATYIGGNNTDRGSSLSTDATGNVYLSGDTYSSAGLAATGAFQTSLGGTQDVFLAKFSSAGVRLWATYYGGSGIESGGDCATDGSGNVFLSGYTNSTSGIATSGAYQTANAGQYDGFLAKFTGSGARSWATYYGGAGDDYMTDCLSDAIGNALLLGYVDSSAGLATSGVFQSTASGGNDGLVVKFSSGGSRVWTTYLGGTGADYVYAGATDGAGNIYTTGYATSTTGIASANPFSLTGSTFLLKLSSGGARIWGSRYGGNGVTSGRGIAVDPTGNVYLSGSTSSSSGLATSGAYQAAYGGSQDLFLSKISELDITSAIAPVYCAGATFNVSFSATLPPTGSNVYTAQISDASGGFFFPATIGTLTSTAMTGAIPVTIPAGTPSGKGYRIRITSSHPAFTGDDNGANITIGGTRMYVDASAAAGGTGATWFSPFKTLNEALDIANATNCPQEIWVANGTYKPTTASSRDSSFRILRNGIKLYGGFAGNETTLAQRNIAANVSILSGDIGIANDSTDNSYHVLTIVAPASGNGDIDSSTVVDGVTITRGKDPLPTGSFTVNGQSLNDLSGGGIYLCGNGTGVECSPKIASCTITRNSSSFGGGIYASALSGGKCRPVLESCTISSNRGINSGGGADAFASGAGGSCRLWLRGCTVSGNKASNGAGLHQANSSGAVGSAILSDCVFTGNQYTGSLGDGGGLMIEPGAAGCILDVNRCSFSGNNAIWGSAIRSYVPSTIDSSYFTSNIAGTAGAVSLVGGSTTVSNCSFTDNNGSACAGIDVGGGATLNMSNTIFRRDSASTSAAGVRVIGASTINALKCRFLNNRSGTTGCVAVSSGAITMNSCVFSGNTAGTYGAAADVASGQSATFTNCVFAGNATTGVFATPSGGGALHLGSTSTTTLNNCSFSANTTASAAAAGSNAILTEASATLNVRNSIIWGAAASQITGSGTTTYSYSNVRGISVSANNLNTDPIFIAPAAPSGPDTLWATADDGLRLATCSPAINAGSNSLLPSFTVTDITGATRTQQTTVDMGAYEASNGGPLAISGTPVNPTNCASPNSSFTLYGASPALSYTIYYSLNGTPQTPFVQTSTAFGILIIPGLPAGTYTNISITGGGCISNTLAGPYVLTNLNTPVISSVSATNPTTCGGSNGAIAINGLTAAATYAISYVFGGSTVSIASATASSGGTYSITGLSAGTYSSLTLTRNGCSATWASAVNLTSPGAPAAPTATANGPLCSGSTLNLSASAISGASYSWTGPGGYTTAVQNPSVANAQPSASGTYYVTATVSGCTSAAGSIVVTVAPTPAVATLTPTDVTTCGGADGTIALSGLAAGNTYTIAFSQGGVAQTPLVLTAGAGGTISISNLSASTYSAITAAANGCISVAVGPVSVAAPAAPAAPVLSNNSPICAGDTLKLMAASPLNGAGFSWSGPASFSAIAQSPVIINAQAANAGSYSATVTDPATGCSSAPASLTAVINPLPVIGSTSFNNPAAYGGSNGSITLSGLAANTVYTVSYSKNGVGLTTTITANASGNVAITGLTQGVYSNITVNPGACPSTPLGPVTLSDPAGPTPPIATSNAPVCAGGTLSLSATSPAGAGYFWTGPGAFSAAVQSPSITNAQTSESGTYYVTATVGGCTSAPDSVVVVVHALPVITSITASAATTCGGASGAITLGGLMPTTSYSINYSKGGVAQTPLLLTSDASGNISITGLNAAAYTAITASLNGCTSASAGPVTVSNPVAPAAPVLSSNAPVCAGDTLKLAAASPLAAAGFSWNGPAAFSSTAQAPDIAAASAANSGAYSATVTDLTTGCTSAPASVTASINALPVIGGTSSVNPATCGGTSGSIVLSGLTANAFYTISYSKNSLAQTASIAAGPTGDLMISGLGQGVYSAITVQLGGCASAPVGPITLSDPTPPTAPALTSSSPVCQGNTLTLSASGAAGASYSWSGPGSFSASGQNVTRAAMTTALAGTYSVTQTVGGCTSPAATVSVSVSTPPAAPGVISGNTAPCAGASVTYSIAPVTGATGYIWNVPAGWTIVSGVGTTGITATAGSTGGPISVAANSGCGPGTSTTLLVTVSNVPAQPGAVSGPAALCAGTSTVYGVAPVSGATSYTWTLPVGWTGGGSGMSFSIPATVSATSGTVSVVANNGCGPSLPASMAVTVTSVPAAPGVISGSATPCVNSLQAYSVNPVGGATSYNWSYPSGGTPAWIGGSLTSSIALTVGTASGAVAVSASNNCGTSAATALPVTVTQLPAQPAAISGPSAPCVGSSAAYSVAAVTGVTSYLWSFPATWVGASISNAISLLVGASGGTVSVTPINVCGAGPAQSITVGTTAVVTPTIALSRSTPSDTICAGTAVTFTASASGGGAAAQYIFRKNGTIVFTGPGSTATTYTDNALSSGDVVSVTLLSSLPCVPAGVFSDSVRIIVRPTVVPGININATPPTTNCAGVLLYFSTNITGGGQTPSYQWYLNGTLLPGASAATYNSATLTNGDTLQVRMTTSALCASTPLAFSNKVGLSISPVVTPSVAVSATPSGALAPSTRVVFSLAQSGGGTTPAFQWLKNGVDIPGETGSTFSTTTLANGDRIAVRMQSYDPCANPSIVTSEVVQVVMQSTGIAGGIGGWDGAVTLYPNPSSGRFTVAVQWRSPGTARRVAVDVVNAVGQRVYHSELQPGQNTWSTDVALGEGIADGAYLLRLSTDDGMRTALPFVLRR